MSGEKYHYCVTAAITDDGCREGDFGGPDSGTTGSCFGDIDGDGMVGISDFLGLLETWGLCPNLPAACPADFAFLRIGSVLRGVGC